MAHDFPSALWPEGEHRSLLRAALLDGPPAVAAFHEWRERIVFDDIDQSSFRLLPLLRWNMNRLGVNDPLMPRLDSVCRFLLVETTMKLDAMRKMLLDLRNAGIPRLLLKGAAVGQRYYPHPSLRPMADCDVLIPHKQHRRALERLCAAGWRFGSDTAARHYAAEMWHPPFKTIQVELHWRSGIQATLREDRAAWKAAVPIVFREVPCHVFCPEDEIIHTCRHGFNWCPQAPPMRWLVDCALIVRHSGAKIDWNKLAERARATGETLCVRRSLEWIRRELDAPVPADAFHKLRAQGTSRRERRIYVLKAKPRDWSVFARLLAEFLNREIPCWLWPLHPVRVPRYFAGQFELPDHADIFRYFVYHFWHLSRGRGYALLESGLAKTARMLGVRRISSKLLRNDFTGQLEEPSIFCWARRKVKLEGFVFAHDGSPHQAMRITHEGRILPWVAQELTRVDISCRHPKQPNTLHSGFSITVDLPPGECQLVIEYRDPAGWQPLFEVRIDDFQLIDGAIFPEKFPLPLRRIEFGNAGCDPFLLSGWSNAEPPSRWSAGRKAEMIFGFYGTSALVLSMKLFPLLVPEKVPEQTLIVSLNGSYVTTLVLSNPVPAVYTIRLPAGLLKRNNFLAFGLPAAVSPASLHLGSDTRELGIHVEWMEFRAVKA